MTRNDLWPVICLVAFYVAIVWFQMAQAGVR